MSLIVHSKHVLNSFDVIILRTLKIVSCKVDFNPESFTHELILVIHDKLAPCVCVDSNAMLFEYQLRQPFLLMASSSVVAYVPLHNVRKQ